MSLLFNMLSSYYKSTQHIKKQRHHIANKGSYIQSYGFSSSHVQMWELDHKEGWTQKNWWFPIVALENTLESPLDCKIKPVNSKGNQSWIFIGRTEAEAPILWLPDMHSWLIGKDPDAGKDWRQEKRMTEDEMIGWHHWLKGQEFEQAPGDSGGQRKLGAAVHGVTKSRTQLSDWTITTTRLVIAFLPSSRLPS